MVKSITEIGLIFKPGGRGVFRTRVKKVKGYNGLNNKHVHVLI